MLFCLYHFYGQTSHNLRTRASPKRFSCPRLPLALRIPARRHPRRPPAPRLAPAGHARSRPAISPRARHHRQRRRATEIRRLRASPHGLGHLRQQHSPRRITPGAQQRQAAPAARKNQTAKNLRLRKTRPTVPGLFTPPQSRLSTQFAGSRSVPHDVMGASRGPPSAQSLNKFPAGLRCARIPAAPPSRRRLPQLFARCERHAGSGGHRLRRTGSPRPRRAPLS